MRRDVVATIGDAAGVIGGGDPWQDRRNLPDQCHMTCHYRHLPLRCDDEEQTNRYCYYYFYFRMPRLRCYYSHHLLRHLNCLSVYFYPIRPTAAAVDDVDPLLHRPAERVYVSFDDYGTRL